MKRYKIKEIYYTIQGEGGQAGRAAVFCRFAGCNLWSGLEKDREKAVCQFCDTDFWGTDGELGGKYAAAELVEVIKNCWKGNSGNPLVVCTGGEPLLQLDDELVGKIHEAGLEVAVETNGTQTCPEEVDWICVSPKANAELVLKQGNELKLVFPQPGAMPDLFVHLDFEHFFLQPMDGPNLVENTRKTIEYCLGHPQWRLSLQSHKLVGLK